MTSLLKTTPAQNQHTPASPASPPRPDPGHQAGQDPQDAQDAQHQDALIRQHLGLAHRIAGRYTGRGVETDDLHQVASLALVSAATRFEAARGSSFAAYATVTIHGTLKRHLRDHAWAVRPPRAVHDTYHQVTAVVAELTQTLGSAPSISDLASHLNISPEHVRQAQQARSSYTATSLDALTEQRSGEIPHELLAPGSGDVFDNTDLAVTIEGVMGALTTRDQHIVRLRFEHDMTQREIGNHLGISQMQVSRLLSALTAHLRTQLAHVA